jgi:hypothetical protein
MYNCKLEGLRRELRKCTDPERKARLLELIDILEHESKRPVRLEKVTVSFSEESEEEEEEEDW